MLPSIFLSGPPNALITFSLVYVDVVGMLNAITIKFNRRSGLYPLIEIINQLRSTASGRVAGGADKITTFISQS